MVKNKFSLTFLRYYDCELYVHLLLTQLLSFPLTENLNFKVFLETKKNLQKNTRHIVQYITNIRSKKFSLYQKYSFSCNLPVHYFMAHVVLYDLKILVWQLLGLMSLSKTHVITSAVYIAFSCKVNTKFYCLFTKIGYQFLKNLCITKIFPL